MAKQKRSEQRPPEEQLLVPLDFEVERSGRGVRAFLIALLVFLTGLGAALAAAPLREVAFAPGAIKPFGEVVELRHVAGGSVVELAVRPGDTVEAGDLIMQLDGADIAAELHRMRTRRAHLRLQRAKLSALLLGRRRLPPTHIAGSSSPAAIAAAQALMDADRLEMAAKVRGLENQAERHHADTESKQLQIQGLSEEIATYEERIEMLAALVIKGVASKAQLLTLRAQYAEARSRRFAANGAAQDSSLAAHAVAHQIEQIYTERRLRWSRELSDVSTELDDIDNRIAADDARLKRMTVTTPIKGVVQALGVAAPGGVVSQGGLVASIVPAGDELVAEVRVSPDDIGHIAIGHDAQVRISTFDSDKFGEVNGVVSVISPTSFETESGERYYAAQLTLDHINGEIDGREVALSPGMIVTAEIKTGAKSVLRYLFKPVVNAMDNAFVER
ncbi:MAG: HlyD family type I secretion periplasmic adaptor subunit [Rhodobacteraceae bacterium]|nr:HlyD family type I secretion periplasmic adaptor subunit [Paracoccaceae bacterium]